MGWVLLEFKTPNGSALIGVQLLENPTAYRFMAENAENNVVQQ